MAVPEVGVAGAGAGAGAGDGTKLRHWTTHFSTALRRKLIDAVACRRLPRRKVATLPPPPSGSDPAPKPTSETETTPKIEPLEPLQRLVSQLAGDDNAGHDQRLEASAEVRWLAKNDAFVREKLAMLGAIPLLVAIVDLELHVDVLYALLNLGIGNDKNKAAIVEAGAIHKILTSVQSQTPSSILDAIVANLLSLSALDSNKPIIASATGAIPFLLSALNSARPSASEDALRALFNLSIDPNNAAPIVESGAVPELLSALGDDPAVADRALSTLSNLAVLAEGRRAIARAQDAIPILVDALAWSDAPNCQEKALYVLMLVAHKSPVDRAAMADAGLASSLLELMLVGSPLAQKRASRLLEMVNADKGKSVTECPYVTAVSAPLYGVVGPSEMGGASTEGMSDEKRAVKELVQQSLHSNMRRIARRAHFTRGDDTTTTERLQTLTASSTSKSLPF